MNIFDILGYRSDRAYSVNSKTSVGQFALVAASAPSVVKKLYVGSVQAQNVAYSDASAVLDTTVTIYLGSTKVFG